MARRSKFEHLKPSVMAEFEKGLQPKDIYCQFSEIPESTVREWFKAFRADSVQFRADSATQSQSQNRKELPKSDRPSNVIALVPPTNQQDIPDFELARQVARAIATSKENVFARLNAASLLIKISQIKAGIKTEFGDDELTFDPSQLSNDELRAIASGE